MIKVSVVIPVYNVAEFLPKCMDSLVNQTLHDIEIICVDDGSTDNSLKILQQYADIDSRIKVISHNHMGVGAARNTGLAFANGEYIGFVDSDDWIDADWYEKLYMTAKKSDADVARALIIQEFPDGTTKETSLNKKIHDCATTRTELSKQDNINVIWDSVYKRGLLLENKINFIFGYVHEDVLFQTQVSYYADKIVPVDNTWYHYRQKRAGQITETNISSVIATFYINHYLLDFANMVKYKNRADYIDVVSLCVWRADDKFMYGVKYINDFTPEIQKKYFTMWRRDLLRCNYLVLQICRRHWLRHVLVGNMKAYIRARLKKSGC